jgi:hypothetical protein
LAKIAENSDHTTMTPGGLNSALRQNFHVVCFSFTAEEAVVKNLAFPIKNLSEGLSNVV